MSNIKDFLGIIEDTLEKIEKQEQDSIREGAEMMAEKIEEDELINIFGTGGHSNMGAEELFYRAGGLACINPIFADGIRMPHVPRCEGLKGYAKQIFDHYGLEKGDLLLINNAYGINYTTVDAALLAKEKGIKTIGITGTKHSENLPDDFGGKHPSGKGLHEIVDVFVNTYIPYGDAAIEINDDLPNVASISTITNVFALHSLVIKTVEILAEKDIEPPIVTSANIVGGKEENRPLLEKYGKRIKWLPMKSESTEES